MESTKEVFQLPNGEVVTFIPETHQYFIGASEEEVPSITQLIKAVNGDSYKFVNPEKLKMSADYGTKVHGILDELIQLRKGGIDIEDMVNDIETPQEVKNYFNKVEKLYKIEPVDTERVVVLYDEAGKPIAAGRFDLICTVDNIKTLADFKTTSSIVKNSVIAQLNLYLKAASQSGYVLDGEIEKLGVVHLSGETARFVPIPIMGEKFLEKFMQR